MTYQDAPDEIDDLFKLIIQSGHGIEINTSVYDTLGFFLPDYDIVRRYKELGGEIITTGSDSHNAVRIAANLSLIHIFASELPPNFATIQPMGHSAS